MKRYSTLVLCLMLSAITAIAQDFNPTELAKGFMLEKSGAWQFSGADLDEMIVSDQYVSKHNGVTHVYLQQYYEGIPVYNAIQSIAVSKEGKVFSIGQTAFSKDIQSRISSQKAKLKPIDAIQNMMLNLEKRTVTAPELLDHSKANEWTYAGKGIAKQDIPVRLVYEVTPDGQIRLAYQVQLDQNGNSDWWNARVDAITGEIIAKDNYTISCKFAEDHFHNHDRACQPLATNNSTVAVTDAAVDNSYLVIPFGIESPVHGSFSVETEPWDMEASPYGWHDVNGVAGPEYTITRGNNVHAFQDHNDDDISEGDEPDGGSNLDFNFPTNFENDPTSYTDAATVNLFYWINTMHDFGYVYGFDEAAGNFQQNNYTGQGSGNDNISANAQDGYPTNVNNANYSGGSDGSSARIQMFVWNRSAGAGTKLITVNSPAGIAGEYGAIEADFGPNIPVDPITAEVIEINDGFYNPSITDGCEDIQNADEINGKIALIDRGGCSFVQKAIAAEDAGAIAVIICNFEDDPLIMGAAGGSAIPGIPAVSLGGIDCSTIRIFAGSGLEVSLAQPSDNGPEFVDGDYDSGIIGHEFAHGISNRLTGGPSQGGCLSNAEQMGEGWSDFFGMITSVKTGDTGDMRRGVGTFVSRQENDGRGIRRYPYSTDMSINPLTYADVAANTGVHALGEVWNSVIWDLYWKMVEVYGFDEDLLHGEKGNNLAVQLVMDGMKLQNCNPGFISGRDGILVADEILTGGANSCLIWEVFARRGMGYYADEGSTSNAADQVESFEPLPTCIEELKMTKSVDPIIDAGDNIKVTLNVVNHKPETLTGVVVREQLVEGLTFVEGSSNVTVNQSGDELQIDLGDMNYLEEATITYELKTSTLKYSKQLLFNGVEGGPANNGFLQFPITGTNFWAVEENNVHSGNYAYQVNSESIETQQVLFTEEAIKIEGDNPVIRFYQNYQTEGGQDGGVFQVTDDFDLGIWENFDSEIFRGGYPGYIAYGTFVIPSFPAFWGDSEGYQASYVDMNANKNRDLFMRFNFATSAEDGSTAPFGGSWAIDDLELMDMVNYNPETCISYSGSTELCVIAEERGTIIESKIFTGIDELPSGGLEFKVAPNPATDNISLFLTSERNEDAHVSITAIDGRIVSTESIRTTGAAQRFDLNVSDLIPGFYIVKIENKFGAVSQKVVIQ